MRPFVLTLNKAVTCRTQEVRALGCNTVPIPFEHLDDDSLGLASRTRVMGTVFWDGDSGRNGADGSEDEGESQLGHAEREVGSE